MKLLEPVRLPRTGSSDSAFQTVDDRPPPGSEGIPVPATAGFSEPCDHAVQRSAESWDPAQSLAPIPTQLAAAACPAHAPRGVPAVRILGRICATHASHKSLDELCEASPEIPTVPSVDFRRS